MTICVNCGKEIRVLARNCPYCNAPITMTSVTNKESLKQIKNEYDHKSNSIFLMSVFIPLFGIILYNIKREEEPLKAKGALSGFLIGTIIYLALISVILLVNIVSR